MIIAKHIIIKFNENFVILFTLVYTNLKIIYQKIIYILKIYIKNTK